MRECAWSEAPQWRGVVSGTGCCVPFGGVAGVAVVGCVGGKRGGARER